MRVVHVASTFDIDSPGGVTIYTRNLASSQVAAGLDVFVIDGSDIREWTVHQRGFSVRGSAATATRYLPLSMPPKARESEELVALLVGLQPDIVHVHQTAGMGTAFMTDLPDSGLRYVVSLHDYYLFCPRITMMDYTGNNCGGPGIKKCQRCIGKLDQIDLVHRVALKVHIEPPRVPSKAVTRRNERMAYFLNRASLVLPVSNRVKELFAGVYPNANYRVAHIGTPSAVAVRPPRVDSPNLRLTMLGTLAKYKGAGVLEALALAIRRPDVEIRFYGKVERPEWADRVRAAGVQVMGAYTPSDLPEIMAHTDIGLALPVWEDNAPQVVMEFLNYGVPVVASCMGGIPDFVNDSNGFLFDPRLEHGVRDAARYLDELDVQATRQVGATLPRLTTPVQHEVSITSIYEHCLAG